QAAVDHARRAVDHRLRHPGQDRHLAQLVLHEAEVGDGMAEGLAPLAVPDRRAQRALGPPDAARPELEAADVEDVEGDLVALADLAEEVLLRDDRVLEDEGAGRAALDPGLPLLRAQ